MPFVLFLSGWLALLVAPTPAGGQNSAENPSGGSSHCASLVNGRNELLPLLPVCEFAHALPRTLPNFVCEQTVTRSTRSPAGYLVTKDVIHALVTYEDGRERYSDVTVNGRPTEQGISTIRGGASTWGELGSLLAGVFSPESKAEFMAPADERVGSSAARVFDFHVKQENNKWWVLRDAGQATYPELRGSISLESGTSRLRGLRIAAANIPGDFPAASATVTINYGEVTIRDLGTFLLPLSAEWTGCLRPIPWRKRPAIPSGVANEGPSCMRNEILFANYRKFAAKTRIEVDPN